MWYLLVWINSAYASSLVVIPEKYPTEEACHAAAKSDRWTHSCIPAPKPEYVDAMPLTSYPKSLICTVDGKNCKPNY